MMTYNVRTVTFLHDMEIQDIQVAHWNVNSRISACHQGNILELVDQMNNKINYIHQ